MEGYPKARPWMRRDHGLLIQTRRNPDTRCFLCDFSQPADSQSSGIAKLDRPQSRQTLTSGDGVNGGRLRVRGTFLYKRISAGMVATASE